MSRAIKTQSRARFLILAQLSSMSSPRRPSLPVHDLVLSVIGGHFGPLDFPHPGTFPLSATT